MFLVLFLLSMSYAKVKSINCKNIIELSNKKSGDKLFLHMCCYLHSFHGIYLDMLSV